MALPRSLGAREYGKFRPTRHGEVAVGVTNEDEADPITLNVTASGDTEIIPTPGAGENIVVKGFHFSNAGASKITVSLKAGSGGQEKFSTCLVADGGSFDKNLIGRYWRLPLNKSLVVVLSGAGDVLVTIETEGGTEPAQEAATLTDALVITEALATETGKQVTDAQSITVALTKKAAGAGKSEALPIAEQLANVTTLTLSDTLSIAESEIEEAGVGGLADSIAIVESLDTIEVGKNFSESVGINEAEVIVHTPG